MSSDIRRAKNIGTVDEVDQSIPLQKSQRDKLFEHDWAELVIRFDPSRRCFEVETAGGSESKNAEFTRIGASDGKK